MQIRSRRNGEVPPDENLWISTLWLLIMVSTLCSGSIIGLSPRQVDTSPQMDFSKFPTCSSGVCISKFTSLGCGTYITTDCFCGKPDPLKCAWVDSVNWACWNTTEAWFQTVCPYVTPVNFTSLPSCAESCFMAAYNSNCYTNTKNCICSITKPACESQCPNNGADYDAWYASQCLYNLTDTSATTSSVLGTATLTSSTQAPTPISNGPSTSSAVSTNAPTGISTGVIAGAAVGGFAVSVLIGTGIYFCFFRPRNDTSARAVARESYQGVAYQGPFEADGLAKPAFELDPTEVQSPTDPAFELDPTAVQTPTDGHVFGGTAGSRFSEGVWEMDATPVTREYKS